MKNPSPIDSIAVTLDRRGDPIRRALDELLTRSFYSGAGYVFECDPFALEDDQDVFDVLSPIREQDRRHAHVLGGLIQARGGVPQTGVFPWWNLDLNYLTVPCLARFVLESLREELGKYDALVAQWPHDDAEGRAAVSVIRAEKARQVALLEPVVAAAERREADRHASKIAQVKKTRAARIAKEKAAAEAAKKAKAAAKTGGPAAGAPAAAAAASPAAIGDPKEPGISRRERGRRTVLLLRQKAGLPLSLLKAAPAGAPAAAKTAAAAAPAAAPAAPAGGELLDPNEAGISPKEKARRQMQKMRAASGVAPAAAAPSAAPAAAPAAAAPAPAAPALAGAELLDPNEPGIAPKEKARRQIAKNRAAGAPAPAAPAAPAAAAPAATPASAAAAPAAEAAPAALPADLGDPNEPGIPPKEKARRQMARLRAQKGA